MAMIDARCTRRLLPAAVILMAGAPAALSVADEPRVEQPAGDAASTSGKPASAPGDESRPWRATFSLEGNYGFKSDLKDSPGEVGISSVRAELGIAIPIAKNGELGLSFASEATVFSFDGATGFVTGFNEPWDDVITHDLSARYSHTFHEKWRGFGGIGVTSSGEGGAEFSDTIDVGGFGGVAYTFSPKLTIGGGVLVATQLEDDVRVLPLLNIFYIPADDWLISTANIGGRGFGVSVAYSPCESIRLALQAGFRSMDFRLDDDGALPNGVGRERTIAVQFKADWKIDPQFSIYGLVGVGVDRELTLDDPQGNRIFRSDADPAPYVGAGLEWKF